MAKQKRYNGYLRKTFSYNGKRYYVYGKTAQELFDNEVAKRKEIEQGRNEIYNPTLKGYYEHFTEIRRREVSESTIRAQKYQFENMSKVNLANGITLGEMPLKDITRRDIEMARGILLNDGKTPQHLNICFAHLNHVFQSAVLDETIDKNPCKALKQLKRDRPLISENRHRALSVEETKVFFDEATKRNSFYLNMFLIMIKCGMRVGEVTALHRTDIDRKNGFIHVRKTVTQDEVGGYIISDNAKTKSGNRDIPLTDEVYNIIKDQEKINHELFGLEIDGIIFKSVEGGILREYSVNREIKRICNATGIEIFTCHSFRNTFATRFIEQRPQDYKILSEILGHKDVSITLNLYTHVMTDNKVKAMSELAIKTS